MFFSISISSDCVIVKRPCKFLGVNTLSWSRDSSVSIVTRLRAGQSRNYVLIPVRDKRFLSPDRLWGWLSRYSVGTMVFSQVEQPGRLADESFAAPTEDKKAYSFTSTTPYALMDYTEPALLCFYIRTF
jgi:hypothetical protein